MNKLFTLLICTLFCNTALIAMDDASAAMTASHPNIDPKYLPDYKAQETPTIEKSYANNYDEHGQHITDYIQQGFSRFIGYILDAGGNIHERISDTDNLLTYAISCKNQLIVERKLSVVNLLLSRGARPLPNKFGIIDIDAFYEWVTPYGPEMLNLVKSHLNPIYKPDEEPSALYKWFASNKTTLTSIGSFTVMALVGTYLYKKRSKNTQANQKKS